MKKNLCLAVWGAALCATFPAAAETALPAAAEVSENASSPAETVADDPNYPDSYNADEQHNISGLFDGNLTYDRSTMVWVNGLYAIYGKSKTTENGVTTENENDDEILLYTDYTHRFETLRQREFQTALYCLGGRRRYDL